MALPPQPPTAGTLPNQRHVVQDLTQQSDPSRGIENAAGTHYRAPARLFLLPV